MDGEGEGRGKDGKLFKEGNTAPDGSYVVGKNRTPVGSRFAEGDGRKRGRRAKGVRNFDSDWEAELTSTVPIVENGKHKRVTRHRAQVKKTMQAGAQGDIRAQQIIYARSDRLALAKEKKSTVGDDVLIEAWLAQMAATSGATGVIGDDDKLAHEAASDGQAKPANPSIGTDNGDDHQ